MRVVCIVTSLSLIQLLQELFHKCGKRFETTSSVLDAFREVQKKWIDCLVPALSAFCPTKDEIVHGMFNIAQIACQCA